jgi:hypothetical protein
VGNFGTIPAERINHKRKLVEHGKRDDNGRPDRLSLAASCTTLPSGPSYGIPTIFLSCFFTNVPYF